MSDQDGEEPMDKLRIAVVGCGNVSQGHIRGWQNHPNRAKVVALVDVVRGAAEERRERFGLADVDICTDWQKTVARARLPRLSRPGQTPGAHRGVGDGHGPR